MKLSIVVPAYNEEQRIERMLEAYLPYFAARYGMDFELIVSVNGSRDRTAEIVRRLATQHPQLRVLVEPRRIGKGGAIMAAGAVARGELIGFVDADGATPPEAFEDLVRHIGRAGLIIASRRLPGAVVQPRQSWQRRAASRVFNFLVRRFFKLKITDTQCGAKLMTAEAWRAIVPHIGLTKWAFDVDMLFKTRRAGYAIREIPTTWSDISGSKLRIGLVSFQMLLAICRLRLLYSPLRWVVDLYDRLLGRVIELEPGTQ
ncbi:MAG: glycosyltransferase family 2 protein [Kiritimatiellae bacterium]|jgi:glycosyltransferase involved in cell wall biosynthesis|nr:glycosyltransferase family 2 protein [Kiritimatiellia bacterium]NLD90299.1 glycosyltransferase family 2 protein [Lentisphaerota bacterium]HOU22432.1 glycosyltransferase family 2 protein [Kiritimatiellia bacterium]HPC20555.1 glycosyltransferase family 2 protein [Kiritimatiellia bacterium]HQN79946.1 glycosyltransferase family 2 protein [Kiritimatiellia bacterium]